MTGPKKFRPTRQEWNAQSALGNVATQAARLVADGQPDDLVVIPTALQEDGRLAGICQDDDMIAAAAAIDVLRWLVDGYEEAVTDDRS